MRIFVNKNNNTRDTKKSRFKGEGIQREILKAKRKFLVMLLLANFNLDNDFPF